MKDFLTAHFDKIAEISVLVFIFVFATCMLAHYTGNEEMSRWIENGAVITILARAFGSSRPATVGSAANPANTPDLNRESKG